MANRRHMKVVKEDYRQDGEGVVAVKKEVMDCPVCSSPLTPPIFQCKVGHLVCSACRDKLRGSKKKACGVCSRPVSRRCHGMERVVESMVVPCSNAAHGCTAMLMAYGGDKKTEHEEACPHAPCFCPEQGCGFAGTTGALLDHLAAKHEWPVTEFDYFEPVDVPVKAGMHVLHGTYQDEEDQDKDSDLFLLDVDVDSSRLCVVSLVRVQAHRPEYALRCSLSFSWFRGHTQVLTLDMIPTTSLAHGLPHESGLCAVPEVQHGGSGPLVHTLNIGCD
ncbi:hypothetical protein ZWY2020_011554 [Hordeum vulgare]|nr:hypothetical protein ZWY2020_011554 [Hordeum vulgare]